jgi:hypothetical protein
LRSTRTTSRLRGANRISSGVIAAWWQAAGVTTAAAAASKLAAATHATTQPSSARRAAPAAVRAETAVQEECGAGSGYRGMTRTRMHAEAVAAGVGAAVALLVVLGGAAGLMVHRRRRRGKGAATEAAAAYAGAGDGTCNVATGGTELQAATEADTVGVADARSGGSRAARAAAYAMQAAHDGAFAPGISDSAPLDTQVPQGPSLRVQEHPES